MTGPERVATIAARNINYAFRQGISLMKKEGVDRESRAGSVLEVPTPVITTYARPQERVLFSPERDCNPFFHLFEALWMLAGRGDVKFLTTFNKRMAEYSDDGITQHGAYGFRWREWFGHDQLDILIRDLRGNHETRRGVLVMWDPEYDQVGTKLSGGAGGKDVPCNTHVYFKVRDGRLLMTVCNRSNDMLWGAYGANVVHMSMLQEYVANKVGVEVGMYTQMSDSFHVYTEGPGGKTWEAVKGLSERSVQPCPYVERTVAPYPLGAEFPAWDDDLLTFFDRFDGGHNPVVGKFKTIWWNYVVTPLWRAWASRKASDAEKCAATDWRHAAVEWLWRRTK